MTLEGTRQRLVRPGLLIKDVLAGDRPVYFFSRAGALTERILAPGEGASVSDIHKTYKQAIAMEMNALREPSKRIKPMVYGTFAKMMQKGRYMGFLEIKERVTVDPGSPAENLYQLHRNEAGEMEARPAMKSIYVLTPQGRAEVDAWERLSSAYREFLGGGS